MRAQRRDANEPEVLAPVEKLGGLWLPTDPPNLDGFLYTRARGWNLCEVKDPAKEGRKHEFTPDQLKLICRLNELAIPFHVLRTVDDTLRLFNATRSA